MSIMEFEVETKEKKYIVFIDEIGGIYTAKVGIHNVRGAFLNLEETRIAVMNLIKMMETKWQLVKDRYPNSHGT